MSRTAIPPHLRILVSEQARYRCGYCLTAEDIVGTSMEIDHLIPEALGGQTVEDNLWLACTICNKHKASRINATDPLTGETVLLFDPRRQIWNEHFRWTTNGTEIVGITATGRATIVALNLNRSPLIKSRELWVRAGWHPPQD